jgi:4'-phosphopantetheinyl transferase
MLRWLRAEADDATLLAFARLGLSARERERLAALHVPKRRRDWLLGRLAAKRLLARLAARWGLRDVSLAALEVWPDATGAPFAVLADAVSGVGLTSGQLLPVALSISHSGGRAFCAGWECRDPRQTGIGCDLERIEPRTASFVQDFFGEEEVAVWERAGAERDLVATGIWSAKESVLKALHRGLRVDARRVEVTLVPTRGRRGWVPFGACWREPGAGAVRPWGWWRARDGWVETLALHVSSVASASVAARRRAS